MEADWPPLGRCLQLRNGLITRYVKCRYPWEEEGNEMVWFNLYPGNVDLGTARNELRMAKTFLHQVRTTRGYGVTCRFPMHDYTFTPLGDVPEFHSFAYGALPIAVAHISQMTGKAYEGVKIENAVMVGSCFLVFLTFDAKECVPDAVPKTFLSLVSMKKIGGGVRECLLKPDYDADWGANEDKVLVTYDNWNPYTARGYRG